MKSRTPDQLLREHTRWRRAAAPLAIAIAGLAATAAGLWFRHPTLARLDAWHDIARWWTIGLAVTAVATLVAGWMGGRAGARSARRLDERLAAKNRIEAATELQRDAGPLARAQREETEAFLKTARRPAYDLALLALAALALLLLGAQLVLVTAWTRPWMRPAIAAKPTPTPAAPPTASLNWRAPEPETQATSVEEVPLEAAAISSSGLRDIVLEVSVNGAPRPGVKLPAGDLASAGQRTLKTSIYLDQLEVQPYDVVSYYLRARRIDARDLPPTVSPVQFVQVKPFRGDVKEMPGGEGFGVFPLIKALKAAQLRLLKENFLLAHTDLDHANPAWKGENDRVGREQGLLGQKAGEVIDRLITDGAPAEIVNLLTQARPLMDNAARKIQAAVNEPALAPQGRALGLITEVEKFVVRTAARDGRQKNHPKDVNDPFARQPPFELKQRFKTQAGELELIAAEQGRVSDDLANPNARPDPPTDPHEKPDPQRITGTIVERQTQISQRAGALANGQIFVPEVIKLLESGREFAGAALRQLDDGNPAAAREPAAAAAREFQQAVEAMNRAADSAAKDQLVKALGDLSRAVEEARNAPRESSEAAARKAAEEAQKQVLDTARSLAEAARRQQETGSQKAAQRLNDMARALSKEDLQKAFDRLRAQPRDTARAQTAAARLQDAADLASRPGGHEPLKSDDLERLVAQMERMRANMQRLAAAGPETGAKGEARAPEQGAGGQPRQGEGKGEGREPGQGKGQGTSPGGAGDAGTGGRGKERSSERDDQELTGALSHDAPEVNDTARPIGASRSQSLVARPLAPRDRERLAVELVSDLRGALQDAGAAVPDSAPLARIREALRDEGDTARHSADLGALFVRIDPALDGLILQLRARLERSRREFQLTDQQLEFAPPAYRAAVADYFEQLSRDYESATPGKKPADK